MFNRITLNGTLQRSSGINISPERCHRIAKNGAAPLPDIHGYGFSASLLSLLENGENVRSRDLPNWEITDCRINIRSKEARNLPQVIRRPTRCFLIDPFLCNSFKGVRITSMNREHFSLSAVGRIYPLLDQVPCLAMLNTSFCKSDFWIGAN